jgi:light-regulated signal transduction histidine kinase (bacteriophytochrome)
MIANANTELAAVNKELESFSYSVSHDLRAPLRSIDGFSQAILEDYTDKLDEQGRNYLQRVRSNTQKMGELIDDLLKLSRVTRSEMKLEMVNLSTLAQSIATEVQKTQPERQVEFVISPGLSAKGDERLLHILLENLLGNAWKFTAKHPQARIAFGSTQVGGKQVFFVRDDGAGFDMTYADKLFAPFQRLHSEGEFPGIGIGLATAQRIIHRHGGRVWAEGEIEKGATFYFTLAQI